jgi:hypothetical protein
VPALLKVKEAFVVLADVGVPPVQVHRNVVGLLVDVLVQDTVSPAQADVAMLKLAVGMVGVALGVTVPVK